MANMILLAAGSVCCKAVRVGLAGGSGKAVDLGLEQCFQLIYPSSMADGVTLARTTDISVWHLPQLLTLVRTLASETTIMFCLLCLLFSSCLCPVCDVITSWSTADMYCVRRLSTGNTPNISLSHMYQCS